MNKLIIIISGIWDVIMFTWVSSCIQLSVNYHQNHAKHGKYLFFYFFWQREKHIYKEKAKPTKKKHGNQEHERKHGKY